MKDPYEFGYEMGRVIDGVIEGIYASRDPAKHGLLSQLVAEAGNGNHLEVGTLYGASAILAALTKKEYNLRGGIYCVDPFIDTDIDPSIKALTDYEVSPERVIRNASFFDVKLKVYKMPFRDFDINIPFASCYIDGDHTKAGIASDWNKVKNHVGRLVFFDDYADSRFPGVTDFIDGLNEPGWSKEKYGQYAILRRHEG